MEESWNECLRKTHEQYKEKSIACPDLNFASRILPSMNDVDMVMQIRLLANMPHLIDNAKR